MPVTTLVVQTTDEPRRLAASVREAVWAIDSEQPIATMATMREYVAASVADFRATTTLLGLFAALAMGLALVGTYGVVSYLAARRTHELGIRSALGAADRDLLAMVLREGMGPVVAGIGVAVVLAVGLTRSLQALLYEVEALDPPLFAAVSVMVASVALVATLVPARRATRVDPVSTLREN